MQMADDVGILTRRRRPIYAIPAKVFATRHSPQKANWNLWQRLELVSGEQVEDYKFRDVGAFIEKFSTSFINVESNMDVVFTLGQQKILSLGRKDLFDVIEETHVDKEA